VLSRSVLSLLGAVSIAVALLAVGPGASAYPTLPAGLAGPVLSNLSAPVLSAGGSGAIDFVLANPFSGPMSSVVLTLGLYAFSPSPGGSTGPLPSPSPVLVGGNSNGSATSVDLASLPAGGHWAAPGDVSISVEAPGGTPTGTFDLRSAVSFTEAGRAYLLESRGYFTDSAWASATGGPNGTSTLNVSRLGVSGIVPESAVLVRPSPVAPWLYGVLGASLLLAGVGGYLAWRRGPGSRSGKRAPPDPQRAASAFGNSRTSEGD
jgi:hypothetical protein